MQNTVKEPLVSVLVICYNSSKFVTATLDSIKNQLYVNIELIISDDCSTDNTVEICREWLTANKDRFLNTDVLTIEENTGTSNNINRAVKKAKGEWIKIIAGDDILLKTAIKDYVSCINKQTNVRFLFAKIIGFKELESNCEINHDILRDYSEYFQLNAIEQYHQLIRDNFIAAPSSFIYKASLEKIGLFDEEIAYMDDYPLWIKASMNGFKLSFLEKATVMYRIHSNNISKPNKKYINPLYLESQIVFYKKYIQSVTSLELVYYKYDKLIKLIILKMVVFMGNKTYLYNIFRYLLIFSPLHNFLIKFIINVHHKIFIIKNN